MVSDLELALRREMLDRALAFCEGPDDVVPLAQQMMDFLACPAGVGDDPDYADQDREVAERVARMAPPSEPIPGPPAKPVGAGKAELPPNQALCLAMVAKELKAGGTAAPARIAAKAGILPASARSALTALTQKGLVQGEGTPLSYVLTDAGRHEAAALEPAQKKG